ncbi:nucleic acid-binding protein [Nitzschia inconspicua]|uniref:Nucleic acid-binding protein n=1 Tax=Nitzschia inconspicua TaxID=303405 RepID=A0A9K3KJ34_9STRA|nr:nucleic acid-binding protein [Nitzschia inconspicua]
MADDLDDFFDDVEQAAAEAVEEEHDTTTEDPKQEIKVPSNEDTAEESNNGEPTAKRQKVDGAIKVAVPTAPPIRPKGVVVAASSSVIAPTVTKPSDNTSSTTSSTTKSSIPPTHVPAYPPSAFHNNNILPPLPPGPPPPPPPPHTHPMNTATTTNGSNQKSHKPIKRVAAGKAWVDESLAEWPENDFRIFVGNLSRDVTDAQLLEHFQTKYTSTAMAKVVKDNKTGVSKGYGFVSFLQPLDCAKAIREQDQKWLGSRPIRVKRSDWKDRNLKEVQKKEKKEKKKDKKFGGF